MKSNYTKWLTTLLLLVATYACALVGFASPCTDSGISSGQCLTPARRKVKIAANQHSQRLQQQQHRNQQTLGSDDGPARVLQFAYLRPALLGNLEDSVDVVFEKRSFIAVRRWLLLCSMII